MFAITVPSGYFAIAMVGEDLTEDPTFLVDYDGSLDDLKTDLCDHCWIKVQEPDGGREFLIRSKDVELVREVEE